MNETVSANLSLTRSRRLYAFVLLVLFCGNVLVHLSPEHHGHSHQVTRDTASHGHSHEHEHVHEGDDIPDETGFDEERNDDQDDPGFLEESTHHDLMFAMITIDFHQIAERVGEAQATTSDGIFRPLPGPYYPPRHFSASF